MSQQVLEGGGLRVTFRRVNDRYGHLVELQCGGDYAALLESIEGSPDEPWPVSPPLQSLHIEHRPGGRSVALLVGMAGSSHWSLSVELDPQAGRLIFDAACRLREPAQWLGSCYRTLCEPTPLAEGEAWRLSQGPYAAELRGEPVTSEAPLELNFDANRLSLAAGHVASLPATRRWGYGLRLA